MQPDSQRSKSSESVRAPNLPSQGSSSTCRTILTSTSTKRWCWRRVPLDQRLEHLSVALEPGADREALGAAPRSSRIPVTLREHVADGIGERLRRRRLVSLPALRVRHADTPLVADQL